MAGGWLRTATGWESMGYGSISNSLLQSKAKMLSSRPLAARSVAIVAGWLAASVRKSNSIGGGGSRGILELGGGVFPSHSTTTLFLLFL